MELLDRNTWQDPSAASASSLRVDAPVTLMVIPVVDLQGEKVDTEKAQRIKQATTPDGLSIKLEIKRDRLEEVKL